MEHLRQRLALRLGEAERVPRVDAGERQCHRRQAAVSCDVVEQPRAVVDEQRVPLRNNFV